MANKRIKTLHEFLRSSPTVARGNIQNIDSFIFDLFSSYPYLVSVKWGDMDSFKHVNNTMYFRYQEVSRGIFFNQVLKKIQDPTFDVVAWNEGTGVGPILADCFCSFKFPVSFPDNLLIGSVIHPHDILHDRFKLTHHIWSLKHQRMAAEGSGTIVCYDFLKGEVTNLPSALRKAIEEHHEQGDSLHLLDSLEKIVDLQNEF
jgi:acyl-CoA thioester hydrolase